MKARGRKDVMNDTGVYYSYSWYPMANHSAVAGLLPNLCEQQGMGPVTETVV